MKLVRHNSLAHADRVLSALKNHPRRVQATVKVWSNCREQGYFLIREDGEDLLNPTALVFAEQRNGDGIVVVFGRLNNFDITTNMPIDALWENNRKDFQSDYKAVKFIVDYLSGIPVEKMELSL